MSIYDKYSLPEDYRLPQPVWWKRWLNNIRQALVIIMFALLVVGVVCGVTVCGGFLLDHFVTFGKTGG